MASRWRELLAERTEEAARILGAVPGVRGLVLGGSVGRGEPWPLSDIDLLPICAVEAQAEIARRHALLIDWWAASGRAQTLDVGWLAFTPEEARAAVAGGAGFAAARMADRRWFHGLDKAFGGRGVSDPDGLADAFVRWATAVRFAPAVVAARVAEWYGQARAAHEAALTALGAGDHLAATIQLRDAARALRLVALEGWGERLGSAGREWTRFERMAARHGASHLAARLAWATAADTATMTAIRGQLPVWLRERIDRCRVARRAIGEAVTAAENARDQIAAFRVHVSRHRPDLGGAWLQLPDPLLEDRMAALSALMDELRPADCGVVNGEGR